MSARESPYVAQYSPLTAHHRANRVPDVYLEVQHLLKLETSNTSNPRQGVALLFRTRGVNTIAFKEDGRDCAGINVRCYEAKRWLCV